MKTTNNTPEKPAASAATNPEAGEGARAPAAIPVFNRAGAKRVKARRHEATAKTVAYEQTGDGGVHLFSSTGVFVATETPAETAARTKAEADAKAAAAEAAAPKPGETPATPAA